MELGEPTGLIAQCKLRTYQKQSLAFMVNREKGQHDDEWDTFELKRTFTNPAFVNSYFPLKIDRRHETSSIVNVKISDAKVGLLCDEVGMGKSLVCIALILANPFDQKRMSDEQWKQATAHYPIQEGCSKLLPDVDVRTYLQTVPHKLQHLINERRLSLTENDMAVSPHIEVQQVYQSFKAEERRVAEANQIIVQKNNKIYAASIAAFREMLTSKKYSVKTTVISTTCTLVGQWYDEIKKWAPSLVVKVYHGSYNNHADRMTDSMDMRDVDVLLTVSTTKLTSRWCRLNYQRVIADEIHGYKLPIASSVRVWGVTATPFQRAAKISERFGCSSGIGPAAAWSQLQRATQNQQQYVDKMNTWMIRHTKNQSRFNFP